MLQTAGAVGAVPEKSVTVLPGIVIRTVPLARGFHRSPRCVRQASAAGRPEFSCALSLFVCEFLTGQGQGKQTGGDGVVKPQCPLGKPFFFLRRQCGKRMQGGAVVGQF